MSKILLLNLISLALITFLISLTSLINETAFAQESRMLVNDFKDEKRIKKPKRIRNIKRPPACVCSEPIDILTNEFIELERTYSQLSGITGLKPKAHIVNCQCGVIKCVLVNQNNYSVSCLK